MCRNECKLLYSCAWLPSAQVHVPGAASFSNDNNRLVVIYVAQKKCLVCTRMEASVCAAAARASAQPELLPLASWERG